MSRGFEGSAAARLPRDTVLECGVCWWTFDPEQGDPENDIAPHTGFSDLPDHWRCPSCDAEQDKFMVVLGGAELGGESPQSLESRVDALTAAYRTAEEAMIGLPVHYPVLEVAALGFRPHSDGFAGVIVTPWCMNVVFLPADPGRSREIKLGATRQIAFPSGLYSFIMGRMAGVGAVETCSLFSPMDDFTCQEDALAAAQAAADALFVEPEPEEVKPKTVSRRFLLTRNGAQA